MRDKEIRASPHERPPQASRRPFHGTGVPWCRFPRHCYHRSQCYLTTVLYPSSTQRLLLNPDPGGL